MFLDPVDRSTQCTVAAWGLTSAASFRFCSRKRWDIFNNQAVMTTEERVLCFERKLLEELGVFQGLNLEIERYLPVVTAASHVRYLNRSDAEQDKRYKQLIPYVVIICNDKLLRYRRGRGGQETRLHGLYSVGIGGHISEEDHGLFTNALGYREGMRREIMEEIAVPEVNESAVAVINDDSTEVGYVHFGVVHLMRVAQENVAGRRHSP